MAAAAVAAVRAWFWNERFWLPHNVTWADLAGEPDGGLQYPRASHVLSAFPLALGIFAVRLLFERFIAKPCAINLGIQDSGAHRAQPNAILEKVFTSITKSPDGKRLEGLSKQLDWDVRKIQRWFRHRRNQDKPTTITKFCESMYVRAGAGMCLHLRAPALCSLFSLKFWTAVNLNWCLGVGWREGNSPVGEQK